MDRWRAITNYLTRMRLVDGDGRMNFSHKGGLSEVPSGWIPWYDLTRPDKLPLRLLFGHWAALEGRSGNAQFVALDTGCVWGRELTAMCLDTGELFTVPSRNQD
jgi:bis(5'-nucleosyl)-tetraphosphatase (symmetrical)